MAVECYRIVVPEDARLAGYTVAGQRVPIAPGEYVVHKMRPKVPLRGVRGTLRFLGAHVRGEDLHVPVGSDADIEHVLQPAESQRLEQAFRMRGREPESALKAVTIEAAVPAQAEDQTWRSVTSNSVLPSKAWKAS